MRARAVGLRKRNPVIRRIAGEFVDLFGCSDSGVSIGQPYCCRLVVRPAL